MHKFSTKYLQTEFRNTLRLHIMTSELHSESKVGSTHNIINVIIHHINKYKSINHILISNDTEKVFGKAQKAFIIKVLVIYTSK